MTRLLAAVALLLAGLALTAGNPFPEPGPRTAAAQDAAPCVASELRDGKLVPTEVEGGLTFSGAAGNHVSEPFALPEGTIVVAAQMAGNERDGGSNIVTINAAPGSDALIISTGPVNEIGPYAGSTMEQVFASGEFMLAVEAAGDWTVTLEF